MRPDDRGEGNQSSPLPHACMALSILALFLAGCGIEEYILLDKPENVSMYPPTTVEFKHSATNNSDVFTGYDVLYRLFDEENKAVAVSGVDDQLEATSPDVLVQRLKAAKYQSLVGVESDGTAIVFAVFNPSNTIPEGVTFRFSFDSQGLVFVNEQESNMVVRRAAYDLKTNDYRNFADYTTEDTQQSLDCAYPPSSPLKVYIRAYIVATGIDMSKQFKQYYSVPVLISGEAISLTQ
jgi:hypothetical protein